MELFFIILALAFCWSAIVSFHRVANGMGTGVDWIFMLGGLFVLVMTLKG